jgi:hypothetical protein
MRYEKETYIERVVRFGLIPTVDPIRSLVLGISDCCGAREGGQRSPPTNSKATVQQFLARLLDQRCLLDRGFRDADPPSLVDGLRFSFDAPRSISLSPGLD